MQNKHLLYNDGKTRVELLEQDEEFLTRRFEDFIYKAETSCIGKELHYIETCQICHCKISTPICKKCNYCGTNICNNCSSCQSNECPYFEYGINKQGFDRNSKQHNKKFCKKIPQTIKDPLGFYTDLSSILDDEEKIAKDTGHHTKGGGWGPDDYEEGTLLYGYVRDDE